MESFGTVLGFLAAVYVAAGMLVPLLYLARRQKEDREPGPTSLLWTGANPFLWLVAIALWPVLLALEIAEDKQDAAERERVRADAARRKAQADQQAAREAALVDKTARTCCAMRPGGEVVVDGARIEARAASGTIAPGTPVRIRAFQRGVAVVEESR
ncbi:MAG: NfeD family protein [Opitutales bacterium]|nr:NfeD family protein [Opitutales bacterium]